MDKIKIYLPSLNGVRAIAAGMVIVHHIEMIKSEQGIGKYALPGDLGGLGVTLFFVLSGFLITYLLLTEKAQTDTIDVKNFYIRRILRIWPLYYLIFFISFFVFSQYIYPEGLQELQKHYWLKFILNFFLLANVSHACIGKVPLGSNLWSVGTEEQFYLLWPLLISRFKKSAVPFLLGIIISLALTRIIVAQYVYSGELIGSRKIFFFMLQFLNLFRIDCMAMGALGAWVFFFKKEKVLIFLFHRITQFIIIGWTLISLGLGLTYFDTLNHIVYALFFAIIITNLAGNKKSIINLEFKPLNFIGKISYGLYLYHFIAVVIVVKFAHHYLNFNNNLIQNIILYVSIFSFSVFVSYLSYHFIESPILKYKARYTSIQSGDAVKESMKHTQKINH